MKGALVFLLLLTFVVNVYSKCKPNEVLDEQTQKCEIICEEGEIFNQEKSSCELNTTCPKGQRFNNATSSCENIYKDDPDDGDDPEEPNIPDDPEDPDKNPDKDQFKKNDIACKGGKLTDGKCICPNGQKLKRGKCVDDPKQKNAKMV